MKKVIMVFGETIENLDNPEFKEIYKIKTKEELETFLAKEQHDGLIILKEFETEGERKAYLEGVEDTFGWTSYYEAINVE